MKINTINNILKTLSAIAFVLILAIVLTGNAMAAVRTNGVSEAAGTYKLVSAISATSTSATSTDIIIAGAKKVSVFMNRNISAANATSTFSFLVSVDGVNYVSYNKMIDNVTNTNAQTLTRVASKQLVGTTSAMLSFDLEDDTFLTAKCVGVLAGTGSSSCAFLVQY